MEFTTTLQLDGKTATGIRVPDEAVAALGGGKRIPIGVTINGTRYASTITTMRGEPKIPVSADIRSSTGIARGRQHYRGICCAGNEEVTDTAEAVAKALRSGRKRCSRLVTSMTRCHALPESYALDASFVSSETGR